MHPAPLSGGLTPSMMAPGLMTPNLMVTGGAALAGAGRWAPDPPALPSHPWMPRPGAPPLWLSSSPYSTYAQRHEAADIPDLCSTFRSCLSRNNSVRCTVHGSSSLWMHTLRS